MLETVEQTGRGALTEMRDMLGMLRDDANQPLTPQPGLGDVPTLVEQLRETGLPVELRIDGAPCDLPVGIELSAYRIVQEALTNALKYAGDARATVHIRYGAESLELEIADDGGGRPVLAAGDQALAARREDQPVGRRQDRPAGRRNADASFLPSVVPSTTRRKLMFAGQNSTSIFRDRRRLLSLIALLLALGEIEDAFFVSFAPGPAVFAALLLAATLWTMRRGGRGGPSLLAALFLFEIANAPFWPRHSTGDRISTIAFGLVALAGLLVTGLVIFDTRRHGTTMARVGA